MTLFYIYTHLCIISRYSCKQSENVQAMLYVMYSMQLAFLNLLFAIYYCKTNTVPSVESGLLKEQAFKLLKQLFFVLHHCPMFLINR